MEEAGALRQTVTRACTDINAAASTESPAAIALVSTLTQRLSSETEGLFDNVVSMMQLLTMSINCAQDFTRSSSDVPLVPEPGSFVLVDVLKMVDKCMASQNCDRTVNIHPLVRTSVRRACVDVCSLFVHTATRCLPSIRSRLTTIRLYSPITLPCVRSRRTSARSSPPTASTCLTTCSAWSRTRRGSAAMALPSTCACS